MSIQANDRLVVSLEKLAELLCSIVIIVSCLVLVGWIYEIEALKSIFPTSAAMSPTTAFPFILAGFSIWLLRKKTNQRLRRLISLVCVSIVILICVLRLMNFFFNFHYPFEQVILGDRLVQTGMGINTAFSFLLLSLAVIFLDYKTPGKQFPSQYFALSTAFVSLVVITGYIYNKAFFTSMAASEAPMTLNIAVGFMMLSFAIIFTRPQSGLMATVTSDTMGGVTASNLLPIAIFVPLVLSILTVLGQNYGFFDSSYGTAIAMLLNISIFTVIIWWDARLIHNIDVSRKEAEAEAQRIMHLKSEFISMVSHELRTPLTVIKGGVDTVLDEVVGPVSEDQKDMLLTVKRNIDRLARLINNVLDYQKLESGRMEFNMGEHLLNKIIDDTVNDFNQVAQKKGLTLKGEYPSKELKVHCDRDKIIQVLVNYLNNALKFTDKGAITIKAEIVDDEVKVSVTDQGMGIKSEDMPKLFQSFSQVGTFEQRKTGGTGLGLSIAKKIVEKHEGRVGVDSVYGQGTTFYFVIPLKR